MGRLRKLRAWLGLEYRKARLRKRAGKSPCRIIIGAGGVIQPGWIPTDYQYLNLLKPEGWSAYFATGSIDAILAEHVWEHLTEADGAAAAATCFLYLKPDGYLRVAVPDGFHPDPQYIERVKPGGSGPGSDDHRVLYNHKSFANIFEKAGFEVKLLEYFDDTGTFHSQDWNRNDGMVWRSQRFDERNQGGTLAYTSIILDARKPKAS